MADLDRTELHKFLSARAKAGLKVTLRDVMDHFGASEGATAKCLSLLAGNRALIETTTNEFDCSRIPTLSLLEFESAASQGKTNTAYVDGLWSFLAASCQTHMQSASDAMPARALGGRERRTGGWRNQHIVIRSPP